MNKNVLFIVLDAVRYDYFLANCWTFLSAYKEHLRLYNNVYSVSCWTVPSLCSLMSGLYPAEHGAHMGNSCRLASGCPFLFEKFNSQGYTNYYLSANLMMASSFWGRIEGLRVIPEPVVRNRTLLEMGRSTIEEMKKKNDDNKKRFVFFHFMDAHRPYLKSDEDGLSNPIKILNESPIGLFFNTSIDKLNDKDSLIWRHMYERGVVEDLKAVAFLFQQIKEGGHLNDWRIIVTADHGEALGEEGLYDHAFNLMSCCTHVPLLVYDEEFPAYQEDDRLYSNRNIFHLAQGEEMKDERLVYSFYFNPNWLVQSQGVSLLRESRPDLFHPLLAVIGVDYYQVLKLPIHESDRIKDQKHKSDIIKDQKVEEDLEIRNRLEAMGYI